MGHTKRTREIQNRDIIFLHKLWGSICSEFNPIVF